MLQQNLHAEGDEDHAGEDGGGALGDGDVALAQIDAEEGDQEGDPSDKRNYVQDNQQVFLQAQADTYGEGIDAGGDTQKDIGNQRGTMGGGLLVLLFVSDAVENHLTTNKGQQAEGHPVVDGFDEGAGHIADEGTQHGEQPLAEAENQGHQDALPPRQLALKSRGGRHHQGVDAEGQGQYQCLKETHTIIYNQ